MGIPFLGRRIRYSCDLLPSLFMHCILVIDYHFYLTEFENGLKIMLYRDVVEHGFSVVAAVAGFPCPRSPEGCGFVVPVISWLDMMDEGWSLPQRKSRPRFPCGMTGAAPGCGFHKEVQPWFFVLIQSCSFSGNFRAGSVAKLTVFSWPSTVAIRIENVRNGEPKSLCFQVLGGITISRMLSSGYIDSVSVAGFVPPVCPSTRPINPPWEGM